MIVLKAFGLFSIALIALAFLVGLGDLLLACARDLRAERRRARRGGYLFNRRRGW